MTYVVNFEEVFPSPRFGVGTPWTQAEIFELGEDPLSSPSLIETVALSPLDTDPENPIPRRLTTGNATTDAQWYVIRFSDAIGDTEDTEPFYLESGVMDFTPNRYDVGSLLRARTKTQGGQEIGTFNSQTRPTGEEVDRLITQAYEEVTVVTGRGPSLPDSVRSMFRALVALRAAMNIELSYFPEQVASGRSAYDQYERQYDRRLKELIKAVSEAASGGEPGASDDSGMPSYGGFPETAIGMEFPW